MKLAELIQEETLQGRLKRLFQPASTIGEIGGKDASTIAKMLQAKTGDKAYVLKKGSPHSNTAIKSVANSPVIDGVESQEGHGEIKPVRLPGGRWVVAVGTDYLITSELHYSSLVESDAQG